MLSRVHIERDYLRWCDACQGTMLSTYDLQRVAAERAAAVLVLCDKFSLDPSRSTAMTVVISLP